jgi:uncharacterized protein YqjF (DUF2071 family)
MREQPSALLSVVDHRPWPVPDRAWAGRMRWSDLAFLHWPLATNVLRPLIPAALEIDTFDGQGWIGIVPFRMEGVRTRWLPPLPTTYTFPELNVRTYVRSGGYAGVWFFSLDAASALAVRGARWAFNLPYFDADITVASTGEAIEYRSRRVHRDAPPAELRGSYRPAGGIYQAVPGTRDHFLVERYCLFTEIQGVINRLDIHHKPWPLQPATALIEMNTMASAAGIELPDVAPLAHFARSLEVLAWPPTAMPGLKPGPS